MRGTRKVSLTMLAAVGAICLPLLASTASAVAASQRSAQAVGGP